MELIGLGQWIVGLLQPSARHAIVAGALDCLGDNKVYLHLEINPNLKTFALLLRQIEQMMISSDIKLVPQPWRNQPIYKHYVALELQMMNSCMLW